MKNNGILSNGAAPRRGISAATALLWAATVMIMASLILAPSVTQGARKKKKKQPPPKPQYVWPMPPEKPRVKYMISYRGEPDFERKDSAVERFILGPKDLRGKIYLRKPLGIAVDSKGIIYVGDTGQAAVMRINPMMRTVRLIGNEGQGALRMPTGMACDSKDQVYVADNVLKRINVYDEKGNVIFQYGQSGDLDNPVGVAVDEDRQLLFVADSRKHQIFVYKLGHAEFWRVIGDRGPEPGKFNFPTFIALGKSGDLYVTDTGNFRIQVFDRNFNFKFTFGKAGKNFGDFTRPKGIAVDSQENIYVVDGAFNNFQIFNPEGKLLLFVGQFGVNYLPGEFNLPAGITIDGNDRIYVTDQLNHRVQVFQLLKEGEAP